MTTSEVLPNTSYTIDLLRRSLIKRPYVFRRFLLILFLLVLFGHSFDELNCYYAFYQVAVPCEQKIKLQVAPFLANHSKLSGLGFLC